MTRPRELHFLVPAGIEDPSRPSGGNAYDRRLRDGLVAAGWTVVTRTVPGAWPCPEEAARGRLCGVLAELRRGSLVLVDGLLASTVPDLVLPAIERLRLSVLLHLPVGWQDPGARAAERAVLAAAAGVVTTSDWTRGWLLDTYGLDPHRVRAVRPGVDLAEPAAGSDGGGNLLCVGAVTREKGHDVLLRALRGVADLPWRCLCVGDRSRDRAYAEGLSREARTVGLADRFVLTGPLTGRPLVDRYAAADVLVLPSRVETYGMVATEALARGLPVLGSDVGGVPEAVGTAPTGRRPGLLVPPGDAPALAAALRCWLSDPSLRRRLRREALGRRDGLEGWSETARLVAGALAGVAAA